MSKPSKNQRVGIKRAPRVPTCSLGHTLERVLVAGVGRRDRFEWRHADPAQAHSPQRPLA